MLSERSQQKTTLCIIPLVYYVSRIGKSIDPERLMDAQTQAWGQRMRVTANGDGISLCSDEMF